MYTLTSKDIEAYKRDGLVILKGVFSKDKLDVIKRDAKKIFTKQIVHNGISDGNFSNNKEFNTALYQLFKTNYPAFLGAAKLCQHMPSLFQISLHPQLMSLMHDLKIKTPAVCVKPIIYFNSPHIAKEEFHYKTPVHQDWRSMQGSLNSIVIWMPLVDIVPEIGPVGFVPGSHLCGLYDTDVHPWGRSIKSHYFSDDDFVSPNLDVGDIVLFSAFTVHKSGNNTSDTIRWSIHFRYNDIEETTFIERNYPHPYAVYHPTNQIVTENFPSRQQLEEVFGEI